MKKWCISETRIPPWLFDENYHTVGDLSESIALLLDTRPAIDAQGQADPSLREVMEQLQALQQADESQKQAFILQEWRELSLESCIVFNKLIMGGFRIGVSEALVA